MNARTKLVLFSDLHRGTGDWADHFLHNRFLYEAALEYYDRRRFTYIELGDGDELIENSRLRSIVGTYGRIFRLLDRFHRQGRFIYLCGNHNLRMKNPKWREKELARAREYVPGLWQGLAVPESVLVGERLLLFHGHQADALSTFLLPASRLFVRFVWRFLQNALGFKNFLSVSQNRKKRTRREHDIIAWARKRNMAAITGHTHRPVFMSLGRGENEVRLPGRPYYFNPGSGVHPSAVTSLEIESSTIRLVIWQLVSDPRDRGRVKVGRRIPKGCRARLGDVLRALSPDGGG